MTKAEAGPACTMPAAGPAGLTVYYDGSCALCSIEIAHYRKQAGAEAIAWVDVGHEAADPGPGLSREAAMARFHVRDADGRLVSGAAGFALVWNRLDNWRWAARLARFPGVTPLLELLYRAFLPVRPVLSKWARRLATSGPGAG
jgi:predicted DCC family thiol-disulfide oxidoreductase YuxK